jgi:hypothetical protein
VLRHFFPYFTVDGPPRQRKRKVDKSPDFRDNGGKPVSSGRRAASGWSGRRTFRRGIQVRRPVPAEEEQKAEDTPVGVDPTLQPPASGRMAKPPPRRGRSDASASGVRPDGEAAPLRGRSDASASGVRPGGEAVPRRGRFNTKQGGRFGP